MKTHSWLLCFLRLVFGRMVETIGIVSDDKGQYKMQMYRISLLDIDKNLLSD